MFSRVITTVLAASLWIGSSLVWAGEPVSKAEVDKLRAALEVGTTGLKVGTVKTSEIPGLYEVQFVNGPMVYATTKGDFFIVGDIFGVGPTGYVNLAEKRRDGERVEQLAEVKIDDCQLFLLPEAAQRGARAQQTRCGSALFGLSPCGRGL